MWRGPGDTLTEMGWFFSKAALVTFGGAYAVLSYVNVAAVSQYGWLLPGQMVVGLGLAETTPGPLIMVLEFVGFVGAYQHPGDLSPLAAGVLGAVVATWATFAPCFLWIFLGAPYIEGLRGNRRLAAALETVTAAVVGVIANLALTFAVHTLFEQVREVDTFGGSVPVPVWSSLDGFALVVAVVSFVGLWRFRWKVLPVIGASALAGLIVNGVLAVSAQARATGADVEPDVVDPGSGQPAGHLARRTAPARRRPSPRRGRPGRSWRGTARRPRGSSSVGSSWSHVSTSVNPAALQSRPRLVRGGEVLATLEALAHLAERRLDRRDVAGAAALRRELSARPQRPPRGSRTARRDPRSSGT